MDHAIYVQIIRDLLGQTAPHAQRKANATLYRELVDSTATDQAADFALAEVSMGATTN